MVKSMLAVFMAAVMCFTTVGCGNAPTPSQLVTALNTVADAASVAVVVTQSLVATGKVDAEIGVQVSVYAQGIGTAVNTSIAELNGPAPNPQKIQAIVAAFAKVATPAFGEKAPQVNAAIEAVSAAVKIFLNNLQSSGVLKAAKDHPNASPNIVLSKSDKATLKLTQSKIADTLAKAAALKEEK